MIPILFNKDAKTKIGYLKDCLKCEVTEERNGQYEAVIEYPASGRYFDSITPGAVIKTKPNKNSDNQFFRIYSVSKPINGIITINLQHISYDLSGYPINEVLINANTTAQAAINQILLFSNSIIAHSFSVGSCSVTSTHPFKVSCCSARAALGGVEGSVLDTFGGEYEFDNYTVKLHKNRGKDNNTVIRYGKNMTAMELKLSTENSYTGIFPYVDTDDGRITLSDNNGIINVSNESGVPEKILIIDMSSYFGDNEEKNAANLRTHANAYLAANDINAVEGSLTVEMLDLSQANHPRSFAALENVNLCDTVKIINQAMGVSASMKVIKTVYDSLKERYIKLELGTPSSNFADTIKQVVSNEGFKAVKDAQKAAQAGTSAMLNYYNKSLMLLTSAITKGASGHLILYPPSNPSELLIIDTDDVSTAQEVMRFNSKGIAHSSTGYNGNYDWGLIKDGKLVINEVTTQLINANVITAGILMSADGKNYFALDGDSAGHSGGYLKATAGQIGGWNIDSDSIDASYKIGSTNCMVYLQAPGATGAYSAEGNNENNPTLGSQIIAVKSSSKYYFGVSPEGKVRADGYILSNSGFKCANDYSGSKQYFSVDRNDTTYVMRVYKQSTAQAAAYFVGDVDVYGDICINKNGTRYSIKTWINTLCRHCNVSEIP